MVWSCRVVTVREKYLENEIFPGQGKVREFCGWLGKFEKSGNGYGRQSSENLSTLLKVEKMYFLMR